VIENQLDYGNQNSMTMAATLSSEPCDPECNEVNEFLFSVIIESFQLKNEDKFSGAEKQLTYTWDGNVIKSIALDSVDEFIGRKEFLVYASPMEMFKKLRNSPIMLNLMAACDDLGTIKLPITHCFSEAVLCNDFNTQRFKTEIKFTKDEVEIATVEMDLMIEKIPRESVADVVKFFEVTNKNFQAKWKKKQKKQVGSNDEDDEEQGPCPEFACYKELPPHCKQRLELGEHVYKIINGHLINVQNKKSLCGETCEVAKKYCAEIQNDPSSPPTASAKSLKFNELFSSPRKPPPPAIKIPTCSDLSEDYLGCQTQNILKSENISQYFLEQMKKIEKNFDFACGDGPNIKPYKKLKKKGNKKHEKTTLCSPKAIEPSNPKKTFINKMKRKVRRKYSFEFGNTYPQHHRSDYSTPIKKIEAVPKDMGWRHDKVILGSKKWFPGQINKTVRLMMKHHLHPYPYDTLTLSNAVGRNQIESHKLCHAQQSEHETLRITKKNGEIFLTMRPLKERKQFETDCNPYLNCSPLKFVLKKHPEYIKKHQARMIMKARGCMRKCICENMKLCCCLSTMEKSFLQAEMRRLSLKLKMKEEMQFDDVYETSDSEIDFAFTPPSVTNAGNKCNVDVAHTGMY
jgi:Domain of unknown function (DUF4776)